jgi:peptide/nickel transport system permease protein
MTTAPVVATPRRLSVVRAVTPLRGRERRLLVVGVGLLVIIALIGVIGPAISPYNPTSQDYNAILQGPTSTHPFGTDQLGRDLLVRTMYAARVDLGIAFGLVAISMVVGVVIGMIVGWVGGALDSIVARVIDVALAFPFLVLVISVVAVRGAGVESMFVAVGAVGWVFYARLTRGEVTVTKRIDYIRAAQCCGFSRWRIFARHLLPNVIIQPLVYASSDLVYALLLGASVSFLGLGVQPPTPEWGEMVFEGKDFITSQWWLAVFPGLAIVVTGLAFSLIGDGIADATRGED